ncbi:MAG: FtsX-like permease family protein, partial [Dehalococcoidia bacterium]
MDSLFGIPITHIMLGLLGLLALSFASVGFVAWRQPILVRMGLRNIRRRRSQSTLIVVGLMLSTLIISAAFATGDTVGYSITNQFFEELEEIDIVIGFDDDAVVDPDDEHLTDAFVAELRAAFADDPQIDGVTGVLIERVPVLNLGARLSEPDASLVGVDLASVDSFRALRTLNGSHVSVSALSGSRAFISESLAREVDAGIGDTVTAFFEGQPAEFQIIEVVRDSSITRELSTIFEPGTPPGGLVVEMSTARAFLHAPGEITFAAVSIDGGVRDSLRDSDEVEERIERYLLAHPDANAEILFTKAEAIDLGEQIGSVFVSIFLIFGLFSIAAGILLIFLIFVMLAAERRPEMGMARAIGMRRLHLTEAFLAEGMAYNAGSAAVGAGLGLAVAYALIFVLARTFDEFGLD